MRLTSALAILLVAFGVTSLVGCGGGESKPSGSGGGGKTQMGETAKEEKAEKGTEAGSNGPVGGGAEVPATKAEDAGATTEKPAPDATTEPAKTEEKKTEEKPAEEKKE